MAVVPTMGALHAGHLALIEEARRRAPFVAVTLFVNPAQFGPHEDLARYPRDLGGDSALCEEAGAVGVFAPSVEAMYPPGDETRVRVGATAESLCGLHRPGHFEGVATVVTKLLVLAGPSVAVFGRKDYQQLRVIERVVRDLFLPVDVASVRTVREPDGLAMSSRNAYLRPEHRRDARAIPEALSAAWEAFDEGERDADTLAGIVRASVELVATSVDYVEVADPESLTPIRAGARVGERALVALAVRLGATRLIDNLVLGEDPPPIPRAPSSRLSA